jgi:uncharacterized protein (DUF58 family)
MIILQTTLSLIAILIADFIIYKHFSLKMIDYTRKMSVETAYVGDNISMVEVIHNISLLPFPWLTLQTKIDEGLEFKQLSDMHISGAYHRSVFSLMPFSRITRNHKVKCTKRGEYKLTHITLSTGDIFGLLSKIYELSCNSSILVYPSLLPRQRLMLPFHTWQGDIVVRRFILPDPFMIAGVREYNDDDPMSTINWKTTARSGSLQVYKRDFTSNLRMMVILNVDTDPYQWQSASEDEQKKLEYAISYCATLADYAIESGFEIGFCTNGHFNEKTEPVFIYPQCSYEQYYEILGALARLHYNSLISFSNMLEENIDQFTNMDILIVTAWVDEKLKETTEIIRYNGCNVDIIIPDFDETVV